MERSALETVDRLSDDELKALSTAELVALARRLGDEARSAMDRVDRDSEPVAR